MIYHGTTDKDLFLQCETIAEEFHDKYGSIDEDEVAFELGTWYLEQEGSKKWYKEHFGIKWDKVLDNHCRNIADMYFSSKDYFDFEVRLQEDERDEHERKLTEETLTRRSKQI